MHLILIRSVDKSPSLSNQCKLNQNSPSATMYPSMLALLTMSHVPQKLSGMFPSDTQPVVQIETGLLQSGPRWCEGRWGKGRVMKESGRGRRQEVGLALQFISCPLRWADGAGCCGGMSWEQYMSDTSLYISNCHLSSCRQLNHCQNKGFTPVKPDKG